MGGAYRRLSASQASRFCHFLRRGEAGGGGRWCCRQEALRGCAFGLWLVVFAWWAVQLCSALLLSVGGNLVDDLRARSRRGGHTIGHNGGCASRCSFRPVRAARPFPSLIIARRNLLITPPARQILQVLVGAARRPAQWHLPRAATTDDEASSLHHAHHADVRHIMLFGRRSKPSARSHACPHVAGVVAAGRGLVGLSALKTSGCSIAFASARCSCVRLHASEVLNILPFAAHVMYEDEGDTHVAHASFAFGPLLLDRIRAHQQRRTDERHGRASRRDMAGGVDDTRLRVRATDRRG